MTPPCTIDLDWHRLRGAEVLVAVVAAAALALSLGSRGAAGSPELPDRAARAPERVELPALRTRTSRTFRNNDGTRTSEFSTASLHYRDGSGDWRPISTQLVPAILEGFHWQNEANGFRILFRQLLGGDFLRLEVAGLGFGVALEGASPVVGLAVGSRVVYANAMPGVDLRYDLFADGIRKTLVLANSGVPASYRFRLTPPTGVSIRTDQRADGSWAFFRTGDSEPLFALAPPFAKEAVPGPRRSHLTRASLSVTPAGNDFMVEIGLDPSWLQAPERRFPVLLDPTITVWSATEADFRSPCGTPPCNGGDAWLAVGGDTSHSWRTAAYFNIGAVVPSSAYVLNAGLFFFAEYRMCLEAEPNFPCWTHTLDAHRITTSWSSNSATDNITYDAAVLDSDVLPADWASTWLSWTVTNTVRSWHSGQLPNHGLLLRHSPESSTSGGPELNGSTRPEPPRLNVTYNLPPNAPSLESPADLAALDTATPVLRASVSDPEGDVMDYLFRVTTGANCAGTSGIAESDWITPETNTPTFTVPPGILRDGQTYYWCALARDEPEPNVFRSGPWSATRSFNVRLRKLGIRDYWPMWSRGPIAVNQANGNLVLTLPGPSYPYGTNALSASVSYNAQAPTVTPAPPLGQGWHLDTGDELASPPAKLVDHNLLSGADQFDAVERVSGDGSSDYYTHVGGSNTYLSAPGDGSQLTKNADGSWTLLDSDGAIYTFGSTPTNGAFPLSSVEFVDADPGQTPLYHCFTADKLTSIRNANCGQAPTRELQFRWASLDPTCTGAILCLTGPDLVTWKYIGDQGGGTSGRLVRVHNGTRDIAEVSYGANGLPNKVRNANDLNPGGASPGYNPAHALTLGYDTATPPRVTSISDGPVTNQTPATSTWTFSYHTPCPQAPAATRAPHDGIAQGTVRANEGCTKLKPPRQQSEFAPKMTTTFVDNLGRPIQVTDLLGNITLTGYDTREQLLWSEDEDGNPTDHVYADVEGNPPSNAWIATGKLSVTGPDPDGPAAGTLERSVTRYRYDETRHGEDLATASGQPITDAVRATGFEGDGRAAPDSSYGIWAGTLNHLVNGSVEVSLGGWTSFQCSIARITSRSKFGGASLRATVSGSSTSYSTEVSAPLSGDSSGKTFTGSLWLYAEGSAVGKPLSLILREQGGPQPPTESATSHTLTAGWQRVAVTRTVGDPNRTSLALIASRPSGATAGEYIDIDGAQIEEKPFATPYVDGGSRAGVRVQVPTALDPMKGWVAIRMRAGIASSSAGTMRLFNYKGNGEVRLRYSAGAFRLGRCGLCTEAEATQTSTFAAGDLITVIGQFQPTDLKLSVNGAAFTSVANSTQPSGMPSTFDLGQLGTGAEWINSDILWAATGGGTLTDADAAAIHAFGTETPGTWSYPVAAKALDIWTADTTLLQKATPAAGPRLQGLQAAYYANPNLVGRPAKLQHDANIDNNWGTGGPSALGGGVVDNFSVRWSGYLSIPAQATYSFHAESDDGVRLTVDGTAAINDWVAGAYVRNSQPITLSAGLHRFTLEYYEGTGSAQIRLRWTCASCGITNQIVPQSALRPGWFNQTSTVSPAGRTSFSHFPDPANARSDYSQVRLLDGTNLVTSFSYDAYGRVTKKVMPKGNASRTIDASGNLLGSPDLTFATTYEYYGATEVNAPPAACGTGLPVYQSQLLKSTAPRGVATTEFVYDVAGRQRSKTNGAGTTCSSYDAEGRLTSTQAPGDPQATTYTYDPVGAQRTATDASGTVTSEYDEQGRVKRSVDSFAAETKLKYDAEANIECRIASPATLPAGPPDCSGGANYTTLYVYDAKNRLLSLTDPAGRLYRFFYDAHDNLKATSYPNGTFSWRDYAADGWLVALYNRHGTLVAPLPPNVPADANPIADFSYAYEGDGKKARQTRIGAGLATETETYRFDAVGRMEQATLPEGNDRRYFFDRDSNRTKITENGQVTATYVYDPANPASDGVDELTSVTEASQTRTFVHDADGKVIQRGPDTIAWDGWGRHSGGTFESATVSYGFDALGFRRQRTVGGTTTRYLHGGLFETDSSGSITSTDVDGAGEDLAQFAGPPTTGSAVSYRYYNGHGDLAAEADQTGTRTSAFTYEPFGSPRQATPSNTTVERWTGRWDKKLDTATALIEMGARPYDPTIGRFLAVDPVDGGSLNSYDYAGQDPINAYDLDGRYCWGCIWAVARGLAFRLALAAGGRGAAAGMVGAVTVQSLRQSGRRSQLSARGTREVREVIGGRGDAAALFARIIEGGHVSQQGLRRSARTLTQVYNLRGGGRAFYRLDRGRRPVIELHDVPGLPRVFKLKFLKK